MQLNKIALASLVALGCASISRAANSDIKITEVNPNGSGASYGADWFELTNFGATDVDITGWKIDDNSALFSAAVAFRDLSTIKAGQSAVFFEGNTAGTNSATIIANFETAWFGTHVPTGFAIGSYGGSGVGLSSTNGDAVNIYDSTGNLITGVSFGAVAVGATLDNPTGATGVLSTPSVVGTNGAFLSAEGLEVGSPGVIANAATPEPASLAFLGFGATALLARRRKNAR